MSVRRWAGAAAAVTVALCLLRPGPIAASPQSETALRAGIAELDARAYKAALDDFNRSLKLDPNDARALFFQGYALNRLSQPGPAYAAFDLMRKKGVTHPDLDFEQGWAAVATGRWRQAVAYLGPYEAAHPKDGEASELLGRAELALRHFAEAEAALGRAMARDPARRPTSLYLLAELETLRGTPERSEAPLERLLAEAPDSPPGLALRNTGPQAVAPPETARRNWTVGVSVSGGANDNVVGLPNNSVLPADVSSKDSGFVRTTLDAAYEFRLRGDRSVVVAYDFAADTFTDVDGFDYQTHEVSAAYHARIAPQWAVSLRGFGGLDLVGLETAVRRFGVEPSGGYLWDRENVTTVTYTFSSSDFTAVPVTPFLDRDADTHVFTLAHTFRMDGRLLPLGVDARVAVFALINDATGNDFEFHGRGAYIALARDVVWGVRAYASYTRELDDYDKANSLSGAGFLLKRQDNINRVAVRLDRPFPVLGNREVTAFVNYEYTENNSNIPLYAYTQSVFGVGVAARF